jgi:hypothetical protein
MDVRNFDGDRGSMSLEIVILSPILLMFVLFVVGVGRYEDAQSQVDGYARDAARAASTGRTSDQALALARAAVKTDVEGGGSWCGKTYQVDPASGGWDFRAGGTVAIEVRCPVSLGDVMFLGMFSAKGVTLTSTAYSPIDLYTYRG